MKKLFVLLNDEEIDRLDWFLLNRFDDDIDTEGKDEGVLDMSTLDGFLTAVVSGPVMIPPSKWLPAVWGDFEPVWESERELEQIFSLLVRHMNGIAAMLMESPDDFEPIFMEREVDGKTYTIVDEWCEGYQRGVALEKGRWKGGDDRLVKLLLPIMSFTSVMNWVAHDQSPEEIEILQQGIAQHVLDIHAYWLARRGEEPGFVAGPHRRVAKAGRNEPCPCGSGRKFKRCCLQ